MKSSCYLHFVRSTLQPKVRASARCAERRNFRLRSSSSFNRGPELINIEKILVDVMRNNSAYLASSTFYVEGEETEKLSRTIIVDDLFYYNVAITRHGMDLGVMSDCYQINFEHRNGNIFDPQHGQPDNFTTYLRTCNVDTVYIVGNNYAGNITDTVRRLLASCFKVLIVEDAINNITEFMDEVLHSISNNDERLRFATTEQVLGELSE